MVNWTEVLNAITSSNAPQTSDFDLNPEIKLPIDRKLRSAAVMFGITTWSKTPQVLLTKRASHLKHHPGQISFPGGKIEDTDQTPKYTALREAQEEVGLPTKLPRFLGELAPHETVTGFSVQPIVFELPKPFTPILDKNEVNEAFFVPLAHLLNSQNYAIQSRIWQQKPRYYYTVPYGPYYIWGATARILKAFAKQVEQCS